MRMTKPFTTTVRHSIRLAAKPKQIPYLHVSPPKKMFKKIIQKMFLKIIQNYPKNVKKVIPAEKKTFR
jgi:hypothetical protein